jgi:hypothetical protein
LLPKALSLKSIGSIRQSVRDLGHGRLVAQSFYTLDGIVVFAATYVVAACVYLVVVRLAVGDRARAFKAFSPGMLPPLGIIFGLLVGFVAVQVWNDFDKAKVAVATEASALRAVVLLAETLPDEQRMQLRALINRHIEEAVNREWPAMAHELLTLAPLSTHLVEALQLTVSLKPQDESQRTAQREIVAALNRALDAAMAAGRLFRAKLPRRVPRLLQDRAPASRTKRATSRATSMS